MVGIAHLAILLWLVKPVIPQAFGYYVLGEESCANGGDKEDGLISFKRIVQARPKKGGPVKYYAFDATVSRMIRGNKAYAKVGDLDFKDYDVSVMVWVVRKGKTRANDNPIYYDVPPEYIKYFGSTDVLGTGNDFGKMYDEEPFRLGAMRLYRDVESWELLYDYFVSSNCFATGSWFANEGIYAFDEDTKEFYPLYYLPHLHENDVIT